MRVPLAKSHFWTWFQRYNTEYLQLRKKNKKEFAYWINEMSAHLRAYFKHIYFELGWDKEEKNGKLIITADGRSQYFKRVDDLVAKAPSIPNWEIVALLPPRPIDFLLEEEFGDTGIDPHRLWFSFYDFSDEIDRPDLFIYSELYNDQSNPQFEKAINSVVTNLLGERSAGIDIGYIHLFNLSDARKNTEIYKMEELPFHLGNRKSSFEIDASGRIQEKKD